MQLDTIPMEAGGFLPLAPLPDDPNIDVIIPTRNRAHYLGACLASVRAQTRRASTVWVIDDGSTDNTAAFLAELAREWPELMAVPSRGRGVSAARNTALGRSTSPLVAFIDSDDIWEPRALERLAGFFTPARSSLALVHCGFRYIDAQGGSPLDPRIWLPSARGWIFRKMLEEFYLMAPSTMMVRRDVVVALGGFDERLSQAEDRDLCLRLLRRHEAEALPEILVGLRQHEANAYTGTMLRDPASVLFQRLAVWNRWLPEIADRQAVLRKFRTEAVAAAGHELRQWRFGLWGRLRASKLELARMLFPRRRDLYFALLPLPRFRPAPMLGVKTWLGANLIIRNGFLLRLAQHFGRFKGVSADPRQRQRGR